MKAKHWLVWFIFYGTLIVYELCKAVVNYQSIAQSNLPKTVLIFIAGTLATSIAFLWNELES